MDNNETRCYVRVRVQYAEQPVENRRRHRTFPPLYFAEDKNHFRRNLSTCINKHGT